MKELTIKLTNIVGGGYAVDVGDGKRLFSKIDQGLQSGAIVTLDFANIDIVIASFLHVAVGNLYKCHTPDIIKSNLKFSNIEEVDLRLTKKVMERANQLFGNTEQLKNELPGNSG